MQDAHWFRIDACGHSVKVDQETDKNFVGGGTVFMDAIEVVQDCYAWNGLAVKCEDAGVLCGGSRGLGSRDAVVKVVMLEVVGSSDFRKYAGNHFDNVVNGHAADVVNGSIGRVRGGILGIK